MTDKAKMFTMKASTGAFILMIYAGVMLSTSIFLPWWRMECRAPQYGARVLIVEVKPGGPSGDTREIDNLGHYVGLRSMETFAKIERMLAPYGLIAVTLIAFSLPFTRSRKLRILGVIAIVLVPIGFAIDLKAWQHYAATNLDPTAALSLIQDRVQTRLVGKYEVAQFKVAATFQEGFWFAVIAAFNSLGFLLVERKERKRAGQMPKTAGTIAALLLFLMGPVADARVLEVGAGRDHKSIRSAIDAAVPGDVIEISAGIYKEQIRTEKPLTISGEPGTVIEGPGRGTVLEVRKGPCKIRGLTVRGSGISLIGEDAGIKVHQAERCVIENNSIEDVLFGILVISSSHATIRNNSITGKLLPAPRRGDGIRLHNSHHSRIDQNRILRTRDLAVWQSNFVIARGNYLNGNRYGLHYMYCDDSLFEENVFEDNQVGAAIMYSRRLTLRNNTFTGSRGVGAVGIFFKVADDIVAEDNTVKDNARGLFLEDAPQALTATCVIRNNVIGGNDVGIVMQPSVKRAQFVNNSFIANRVQVEIQGGSTSPLIFSSTSKGNYWSDYIGFDENDDGIGDTPYRIEEFFEDLTSRRPELGLLRMSPAAGAVEMASRAFPVGKPRVAVIDYKPLMHPSQQQRRTQKSERNMSLVFPGLVAAIGSFLVIAQSRHIR